jgi:hypothetical protein
MEYGPHNPDEPEVLINNCDKTLSDPECGLCVEFIYSHMINKFKGDLAELLALEPCITLIQRLKQEQRLHSDVHLYMGETVQLRRRTRKKDAECKMQWGSFVKGTDGLLVEKIPLQQDKLQNLLKIYGAIEVKSMVQSEKKILKQINNHIMRLKGGVKLDTRELSPDNILSFENEKKKESDLLRIIVIPSTWKLNREWQSVVDNNKRSIITSKPSEPPVNTQIEELDPNTWKITLAWSQEALNQAAYEMTFWYMSQVGKYVYTEKNMLKGWEYMTPEEAGYNSIKMMLYYIPLRYISSRQERLAIRLYNVYCFGYALGVDSKEMLWPEDFTSKY